MLEELWVEPEGYFAYHPGRPANIHNANLLGAWLVHVAAGDHPEAGSRVARAVERTLAAQRPDGSWPYGEGRNLSLGRLLPLGLRAVVPRPAGRRRSAHRRGDRPGSRALPQRSSTRTGALSCGRTSRYPEDGHSAGTGLTTLSLLLRRGLVERELLERVAQRVLDTGIRRGHAVHRRYRRGRTTVRYLRWCDAHVALGLVDAAAALRGEPDLAPAALPAGA